MTKGQGAIPTNLENLHNGEEQLRDKALAIISGDHHLRLHLAIVVQEARDRADPLLQGLDAAVVQIDVVSEERVVLVDELQLRPALLGTPSAAPKDMQVRKDFL